MCGFFGIKYDDPEAREHLPKSLLDKVSYRGKDADGIVTTDHFTLGMCQLQTRGSATKIPIESNTSIFGYNGEIYGDYSLNGAIPPTIQKEIQLLFKNTNVNGMYSAIRFCKISNEIQLIRDRFGHLPIFYSYFKKGVIIGSDISVCFKKNSVNPDINGLHETLSLGNTLNNNTVYSDIYQVPPDTNAVFKGLRFSFENTMPGTTLLKPDQSLLHCLSDSVKRCSYTNKNLGVAVSGGLDSSLIYELMKRENIPFTSFSILNGLDGCKSPENSGNALNNQKHYYTKYNETTFTADLEELVDLFKEPITLSSALITLQLARFIKRKDIRVLLTGEGADELFFGYQSYLALQNQKTKSNPIFKFYWPEEKLYWYKKILGEDSVHRITKTLKTHIREASLTETGPKLRAFELKYSLNPLLKRNDRIFLKYGIESRTPFLHSLVPEFAYAKSMHKIVGKQPLISLYEKLQNQRVSPKKVPLRLSMALKEKNTVKMIHYILDHESSLKKLHIQKHGLEDYFKKKDHDTYYMVLKIYSTLLWQKKFLR